MIITEVITVVALLIALGVIGYKLAEEWISWDDPIWARMAKTLACAAGFIVLIGILLMTAEDWGNPRPSRNPDNPEWHEGYHPTDHP